jgi:hypothetical protein
MPGPWVGTVIHMDKGRVCRMVSQEKWDKTKRLILEMRGMEAQDHFPLARLLQIWGFLMYVVRTYPWMNRLHLTIDSWRPFQGLDGFKLSGKELENALACGLERDMPCLRAKDELEEGGPQVSLMALCGSNNKEPPVEVRPVPSFINDLAYLAQLTKADTPPRQLY